jgi:hypothetical protein
MESRINEIIEHQLMSKRNVIEERRACWKSWINEWFFKCERLMMKWLLKRREIERRRRCRIRKEEIEKEKKFRKSQVRQRTKRGREFEKFDKAKEAELLKTEFYRIQNKEKIRLEEEKKYFSKVLSACIRKMEENSARHSFYLLLKYLGKSREDLNL